MVMGDKLQQQQSAETVSRVEAVSHAASGNSRRTERNSTRGVTLFFNGLLLVAVFAAGWLAANTRNQQEHRESLPPASENGAQTGSSVTVTAEPPTRRSVQRSVEAFGTLHGFEDVVISARVEGRVRQLIHDVSDQVKPGELLLEIDPTDYELSVEQSDRALQVELAKLGLKQVPDANLDLTRVPVVVKARSMLEHARSRHERFVQLAAKKTVSPEDSESAANDYRTAQAEYDNQMIQAESGLATIQMKQVELKVAREHLANTQVLVPIPKVRPPDTDEVTYVVSQRSVSEGTLVRVGTELFHTVMNQILKLRVPVPERYTSEVQRDQPVQIHTAATEPVAGTVTRIYPTVDTSTRTFQVEIQVPNNDARLKPGSFAKAAIQTRIDTDAVTVPLSALVQFAGITKIFIVENGRAKEVPVTLGTQTTEWVEIIQPALTTDMQIVTSGQTALANDSSVVIRHPENATSKSAASSSDAKSPAREGRE